MWLQQETIEAIARVAAGCCLQDDADDANDDFVVRAAQQLEKKRKQI